MPPARPAGPPRSVPARALGDRDGLTAVAQRGTDLFATVAEIGVEHDASLVHSAAHRHEADGERPTRRSPWARDRQPSSYLNETRSFVRNVAPPESSRSRSCSTTSATRNPRIVSRAFLTAVSPGVLPRLAARPDDLNHLVDTHWACSSSRPGGAPKENSCRSARPPRPHLATSRGRRRSRRWSRQPSGRCRRVHREDVVVRATPRRPVRGERQLGTVGRPRRGDVVASQVGETGLAGTGLVIR